MAYKHPDTAYADRVIAEVHADLDLMIIALDLETDRVMVQREIASLRVAQRAADVGLVICAGGYAMVVLAQALL